MMMKKKKPHESEEICPFSTENCIKICGLYNKNLEGCSIRIGAHNLDVLSQNIKKLIELQQDN